MDRIVRMNLLLLCMDTCSDPNQPLNIDDKIETIWWYFQWYLDVRNNMFLHRDIKICF